MDGNRFFSVPYDNRSDVKMLMLRRYGGYAAYGRWVALLGILYDQDGLLDMSNQCMRDVIASELELDDMDEFFTILADIGLIDSELYHASSHVVNHGVCDELEWRKSKSEAGKKSGESRRSKSKRTQQ